MWTDHIKLNQLIQMGDGNGLEKVCDQVPSHEVFEGMCFL